MFTFRNSLSGLWRGEYSYDASAPIPVSGGEFTMRLGSGWLSWRVAGVCVDHEPRLSDEPSRVVGWCRGDRLSFEKRYSTTWIATPEGTESLREWLAHRGYPTDSPLPRQRVYYEGLLDRDGMIARGTWRLSYDRARIRSNGRRMVLPASGASGCWVMKRVEGEE